MGRPKGSPNKAKNIEMRRTGNNALIRINMEKQVEYTPVCRESGRGWVNWGVRNDYPLALSSLYYNSPTHKACVDFGVSAIIGSGVDYEKMSVNQEEVFPNYNQTWDQLLKACAKDYIIYGAYAIQVIKNKDDKTYSFYHQPVNNVRCAKMDEDGVITKYFICEDWTAVGRYKPIEIESFNFTEDEEIKKGKPYLFVFSEYNPDLPYYQMPVYSGGIKAVQAEIELLRYDLRSITNNFSASGVLDVKRIDSDEEKQMFLDNLAGMFQGSDNANAIIVNFVDNVEDKAVNFTPIEKSVSHVNLFESTNDRTIDRIVAAHRIPSKNLIGYPTENAQLGGTGNEMAVAFQLYNNIIGNENRKNVLDYFSRMLKLNGIDINLEVKPLKFNVDLPTEVVDTNRDVDVNKDVYDTENVEEKETTIDKTVNNNG